MSERANILFITSDQQHWNTLGLHNPEIQTPHLDRLVREGMLFSRAYCPNPTCTPTRASLITGQYPSQHGAWSLGMQLDRRHPVLGDDFRAAGYRTALVGKGHFSQWYSQPGYVSVEDPSFREDPEFMETFDETCYGFELFEGFRANAGEEAEYSFTDWMSEKLGRQWGKVGKEPGVWPYDEEMHLNAFISERTNRMLDRYHQRGESFFLWASFNDPHPPYTAPEPWASLYDPEKITLPDWPEPGEHAKNPPHFQMTQEENPDFSAYRELEGKAGFGHGLHRHNKWRDRKDLASRYALYYAMISHMDHHIGRILGKLDALGLTESTLIVFTSDHGHLFGHHGLDAKGPFHYEDMVRVPFIARQPGVIPAGVETDALVSLVDFAPTALGWCGLEVPTRMTGLDFSPVFRGEVDTLRDHVIVENRHQPTAVHLKTYIDKRYKLTVYFRQTYGELFDLEADPHERHNRWDDPNYAENKQRLIRALLDAELGKEVMPMLRIDLA